MFNFIEKNSFLDRYLSYTSELTDATPEFNILAGLSLLSSVSHSFCWFGKKSDRLNLWGILIGPSSISRKSTVIGIAKEILTLVDPELIGPSEFTTEGLHAHFGIKLEEKKDKSPFEVSTLDDSKKAGTFFFNEFGGLLKQMEKKDYLSGLKNLLADLYDNSGIFRKQLSKTSSVINPYINILAGSSPKWFEEAINGGDITGGLLTRFIFFVDRGVNAKWKSALTLVSKDKDKQLELVDHLRKLHAHTGHIPIDITDEARLIFDDYSKEFEFMLREEMLKDGQENMTLFARKIVFIKKIAGLLCLSRSLDNFPVLPSPPIVSIEDVNNAIECISFFEEKSIGYLKSLNKPTPLKSSSERLEFVIKNTGEEGISRTRLLQKSHMPAFQLQKELDVLKEDGIIFDPLRATNGRPVVVYVHKDFYGK